MQIRGKAITIFNIVFIVTMILIIKVAVFDANVFENLNSLIIIVMSGILLCIFMGIRRGLDRLNLKQLVIINSIIFIILIMIQMIIVKNLSVNPSWDFEAISSAANSMATTGEMTYLDYFNQYPNNLGGAVFLSIVFKFANKLAFLLGMSNISYIVLGIVLNAFIIDLALVLGFLLIKSDKGIKAATMYSLSCLVITPLYMYVPIFYTDTLSIIYPVIIFSLYYLFRRTNKKIYLIVLSVMGVIGVLIKTNIIIAIVALIIYIIFTSDIKSIVTSVVVIIGSFIIVNFAFSTYLKNEYNLNIKEQGFPSTHWIMMGLNGSGGYNYDDFLFTLNTDKDKRQEENIRVIKERIEAYGFIGLVQHFYDKIEVTWSDGTLFAPEKLRRYPKNEDNKLGDYVYGEKRITYVYFSQMSYVVMLIGILSAAIAAVKMKDSKLMQNLFNISIFGVFLFLLMWETRSRYLVCFLIVMMMSSTYGLEYMYSKVIGLDIKNYFKKPKNIR